MQEEQSFLQIVDIRNKAIFRICYLEKEIFILNKYFKSMNENTTFCLETPPLIAHILAPYKIFLPVFMYLFMFNNYLLKTK